MEELNGCCVGCFFFEVDISEMHFEFDSGS